jgi:vacuolar-type H+-ATPase subunit D/Vma8
MTSPAIDALHRQIRSLMTEYQDMRGNVPEWMERQVQAVTAMDSADPTRKRDACIAYARALVDEAGWIAGLFERG